MTGLEHGRQHGLHRPGLAEAGRDDQDRARALGVSGYCHRRVTDVRGRSWFRAGHVSRLIRHSPGNPRGRDLQARALGSVLVSFTPVRHRSPVVALIVFAQATDADGRQ